MTNPIQIRFAGPAPTDHELWRITRDPAPQLQDGEVQLKLSHVSVDPAMRGWITNKRSYIEPVQPGEIMRAFGVGEVVASKAEGFAPGDWVTGFTGLASACVLPSKFIRKIDISLAEPKDYLSGLGMTGYTAYFGITDIGQPKTGETVVISAAAGAVGSIACQVARNLGARVIGIAGGPEKCAWLRDELKIDGVIDYKNESIANGLERETPDGIDVYYDNVGGEVLDEVLARINRRARLVICGAISQYGDMLNMTGPSNYMALITHSARMQGFTMRDYMRRVPEAFKQLLQWKHEGKLTYRDHVLEGLENFPQAFEMLFRGENTGKLLIKV
jgi:NADPH-dependent curcumin reductase CurA